MRVQTLMLGAVCLAIAGCTANPPAPSATTSTEPTLPQGSEPVELDPADFTTTIDNPYWPMNPGDVWIYEETSEDGLERIVVTVTDRTKMIAGIEARVVRDVVSLDGEVIEDTDDWYAQDSAGNIWYLGEETAEYEDGKLVTRAGSWEHGVDGALGGIALPADPEPGLSYRQEYYAGEAEDEGSVLSLQEFAVVPFGTFQDVLMTRDTTPLEPDVLEYKFYAEGVGPVMEVTVTPDVSRGVLIKKRPA